MAHWKSETYDVVVIGAGPAGLAAATTAGDEGASVALVDAGTTPGGQYWRQPSTGATRHRSTAATRHTSSRYDALRETLEAQCLRGTTVYFPDHQVWTVTRSGHGGFVVHAIWQQGGNETPVEIMGRRLVLAPGAYDRQMPFPGWDLPGVMAAGGVQALLKGHGVRAGGRVLVAGTGPFLLPVAAGLAQAGARVAGVHEAASMRGWMREGRAVAMNPGKLSEGAAYAGVLARHRVPVHMRSTVIAAHGTDELSSVTIARVDAAGSAVSGTARTVEVDTLAVGWGFTPQLELPLALGCETRVDIDGSLVCVVDEDQCSSVPGVFVAGEACGVGGAELAVAEGAIAGVAAAGHDGAGGREGGTARREDGGARRDDGLARKRTRLKKFAAAVHRAHPMPAGWPERLDSTTVVCRCEEVTTQQIRDAIGDHGVNDARAAKLLTRTGMGWCQGRVCGFATACLVAQWSGSAYDPGASSTRPLAAPIRLGELAGGANAVASQD